MGSSLSAPAVTLGPATYDLENYDDSNTWDLNAYGLTYDYDDLDEEVRKDFNSLSILSSFTHLHVVPNLYGFVLYGTEHKRRKLGC